MSEGNFIQTSFLGGEWSGFAQGRSDDPKYRTAMETCLNTLPIEEGPAVRRPGTQRILPTYQRLAAKLLLFASSTACAFACEVTTDTFTGWMRFFSGPMPIFTNDPRVVATASYSGTALSLTTTGNHGWAVGDQFMFNFDGSGLTSAQEALCRGRVLQATVAATNALTLKDDQGNDLTITALASGALVGATILRIARVNAPWLAGLNKLRLIQAQDDAVVLSSLQPPQTLEVVEPTGSNDPVFSLAPTDFIDGPYLDPQPDTGTVSAYTGSITFTPGSSTFVAADVGRHIRLFSQPAAWASGTTYANGTTVSYNNTYWRSIAAGTYAALNVGVPPGSPLTSGGIQVTVWAPAPLEGRWAWGKITAQAGSSCTVALQTNLNSVNGTTVSLWQLGLFMAGSYPICGTYHEGRLWLAGLNRFDASMSNAPFTFSPTDIYDVVNDDSAISYTLNSTDIENILWMRPEQQGIVCGTLKRIWLIAASNLSDPLTPTSIQAHPASKDGSFEFEPIQPGIALVFIQRYGRKIVEYLADTFSGKFSGRPLNEFAKHMTQAGVAEVQFQEENQPVIWIRTAAGELRGCTYRRESRFVTEPPKFAGWHRHVLGSTDGVNASETVNSMCVVAAEDGLSDRLYLNTIDTQGQGWIELLRPFPEVGAGVDDD